MVGKGLLKSFIDRDLSSVLFYAKPSAKSAGDMGRGTFFFLSKAFSASEEEEVALRWPSLLWVFVFLCWGPSPVFPAQKSNKALLWELVEEAGSKGGVSRAVGVIVESTVPTFCCHFCQDARTIFLRLGGKFGNSCSSSPSVVSCSAFISSSEDMQKSGASSEQLSEPIWVKMRGGENLGGLFDT